jgi:ATPase subunit of ABC transporter with duplicated ATPase domains
MKVMKNNLVDTSLVGYTNEIYKVEKVGNRFLLMNTDAEIVNVPVGSVMRRQAGTSGKAIRGYKNSKGKNSYRMVEMEEYNMLIKPLKENGEVNIEPATDHEAIKKIIHTDSINLKPKNLIIKDIKWKYLIRSAVRGKNIMMTGAAGCGKTMAAKHLVTQFERPDFYFNLGSTQDPRATLIGNTPVSYTHLRAHETLS